jgi:GDP-D-mannose dehydratase
MAKIALITGVTGQEGAYLGHLLAATLTMVKARIGGALAPGLTL